MARVSNPIIGKSAGKVGGVVFSSWKGINTLREKPLTVANPQSDGQRTQRNKVVAITALYRLISSAVAIGYKEKAIQMSEYNAFNSYNIKNACTVTDPDDVAVNYPAVRVSDGSLGTTDVTSIAASVADDEVTFNYSTEVPLAAQSSTDKVNCVVYNATQDIIEVGTTTNTRADGSATVSVLMDIASSDDIRVYVFFSNAAGNKSSVSVTGTATAA